MVLISVTRLHLKSPLYLPAFAWHTTLSTWQIINISGFLGGKFLRDAQAGYWTLTTWKDKPAMMNYRNAGAHRQVMPRLQKWCDEASVVHWEQADSNLPTWEEAQCRMMTEGHFTRLSSPSPAQLERKVPQLSSKAQGQILHPRKIMRSRVIESQI